MEWNLCLASSSTTDHHTPKKYTFAWKGRWDCHPTSKLNATTLHVEYCAMYPKPYSLTKLYLRPTYSMHHWSAPWILIFQYQMTNLSMVPRPPTLESGILNWAMPLIVKYTHIHVVDESYCLTTQKAIIFLRDSKIPSSTITKPSLAIRLNCEFRLSFPS